MTTTAPNPAVLRRQALRMLAVALTAQAGWNDERESLYVRLTDGIDPHDLTQACRDLATTWTGQFMPPPATIITQANQARDARAMAAAATRDTHPERGIRRTEFDLDAPLCTRCGGGLMWLTDDELVFCHPCNGVLVMDPGTGRVKVRAEEHRDDLHVAAGEPGRHMRYGRHATPPEAT